MSKTRTFVKVMVAAGLGVAIWTALPGSPTTAIAGSSLNLSPQTTWVSPNGSSLNGSSLNGSSLNWSSLNGSSLN